MTPILRRALPRRWVRRHLFAFDLRGIENREHRRVIQDALNACDYPFMRVRRHTKVRVPITVADTSRFGQAPGSNDHGAHDHSHGVHPLTDPENRAAALGLYWLPTRQYPAGRVEVSDKIMDNVPLAQEVVGAELAHVADYGTPLTDEQRRAIFAIVHHGDASDHGTHGWWEERGGQDYWSDWLGEVFMPLFMRAFMPSLPRPLEARQPWAHPVNDEMARQVREVLGVRP